MIRNVTELLQEDEKLVIYTEEATGTVVIQVSKKINGQTYGAIQRISLMELQCCKMPEYLEAAIVQKLLTQVREAK